MRIKTIVDRAERELAAELLTQRSDKQRSLLLLLPAALRGTSPTPCPQDKGIRGDKRRQFYAQFANMSILERCVWPIQAATPPPPPGGTHKERQQDMNAGSSEEERNTQHAEHGAMCVSEPPL